MSNVTTPSTPKIPTWISIVQGVLILIMLSQVYLFAMDHDAVRASGITLETVADSNLAYEFAGRTATMALVSLAIMFSKRVELYLAMFGMNVLRESLETIIDPMFPLANAPVSPIWDIIMHVIIVAIEVAAFVTLYRLAKATSSHPEGAQ